VDTGLFGFEESTVGKTRAAYPPEFRRQMVELVRAGRSPEELAREFEPTVQSDSRRKISAEEHNRIRPGHLRRRFAQPAKKSPTSLANSAGFSISGM